MIIPSRQSRSRSTRGIPCPPGIFLSLLLLLSLLLPSACTKHRVAYLSDNGLSKNDTAVQRALRAFYSRWRGTPYREGGLSHRSIDCSGLTMLAYERIFGIKLPRTAADQADSGTPIPAHFLRPGDLVFFKTGVFQKHVGIYLGDNRFIHASSSNGVEISSLKSHYWRRDYWKATRPLSALAANP